MMNSQLVQVASWRLISELFRRYPGKYSLIETHPGGGMYDCLSLFCDQEHIADFNRAGSFHVFQNPNIESLDIWRLMAEEDVQDVLDQVCRHLELKIPAKLPPSNPEVIVYRFIAALLSHAVFSKGRWECRNGFFDTSGMSDCGISPAFSKFPAAQDRLRIAMPRDLLQEPAYRFWFILKDGKPVMCFESTGTAWNNDGKSFDLFALYKNEKRIWPVVWMVAGHLLP